MLEHVAGGYAFRAVARGGRRVRAAVRAARRAWALAGGARDAGDRRLPRSLQPARDRAHPRCRGRLGGRRTPRARPHRRGRAATMAQAAPCATARRRSSSESSGSRAPLRCRASTTWARPPRTSASGSTAVAVGKTAYGSARSRRAAPARGRRRAVIPSTSTSFEPIMKSTWMSLCVHAGAVGLVLDREGVGVAERDVAGRVLVEQRLVEDRAERADPALLVDERDLAEP